MKFTPLFSLILALGGCGDAPDDDTGSTTETDTDTDSDTDTDTDVDLTVTETTVDATSYDTWVYLDLDTLSVVEPADPSDSTEWDLGFMRSTVKVNGGVSGTGGVQVAPFAGYYDAFDTSTQAPPHGWITDEPDADGDGVPEYAMGGWYDYDSATHTLSPADVLYFVHGTGGGYFRLRFLDYYDDQGTSGVVRFESSAVEGP